MKKGYKKFDYNKYQWDMFLKLEHIIAHLPKKYQYMFLDVFEACVFGGLHFDSDNYKSLECDIQDGTILYHK